MVEQLRIGAAHGRSLVVVAAERTRLRVEL